ncbi:hypothetical protein ACHAXH_002757 [Discostella pseudostelligera]
MTITMLNAPPPSGIGRRRGAASRKKSPVISIIVAAVSLLVTLFLILAFGSYNFSSSTISNGKIRFNDAKPVVSSDTDDGDDDADETISEEFQDIAGIVRAKLHLVSIDAEHMSKSGSNGYHGVTGSFCKLDWKKYKKDPPSLPMFRMLVSESGCDNRKNIFTLDLAKVVRKIRQYDKNNNDVHAMPPTGFVFHESRVGSTLVANALTAMDPESHRVYSESDPINSALNACQRSPCDIDIHAELLRDVVYLMGRTSSPKEKHMFFKVSSIGSKRIDVMQEAFPSVPWIFVYRDPVQTMMSHMDPAKLKQIRGGVPQAVCLRAKRRPPNDLVELASNYGTDIDEFTNEEFCAAHLATLCESALKQMNKSHGKGVAVEYEGLVDKLIERIIPAHFGINVDESARQNILSVSQIYSKSKPGRSKDWVEDSEKKDIQSTLEIRAASEKFLSKSYFELKKHSIDE